MDHARILKGLSVSISAIDRLTISSGTQFVNSLCNKPLSKPAVIPKHPWRMLTGVEEQMFKDNSVEDGVSERISVIDLPSDVFETIEPLEIPKTVTKGMIKKFHGSNTWLTMKGLLENVANRFAVTNEEQIEGGLYFGQGGLSNSTINPVNNEFVGLHLDSWEKVGYLRQRQFSKNRICFNLSLYPRYLCFLNLRLEQIYDLWEPENYKTPFNQLEFYDYDFIYQFLEQNPEYPIIRVRVDPGQAYIAPTECVLHDGSSEGNPGLDVTYTLRAFYSS